MQGKVEEEEVNVADQTKTYREGILMKKEEYEQLLKVHAEYKGRSSEFDKSLKQSKKTLNQYEKELESKNK